MGAMCCSHFNCGWLCIHYLSIYTIYEYLYIYMNMYGHNSISVLNIIAQFLCNLCQEPELKTAGIPLPPGFDGAKQSYTLKGPDEGSSAVGILLDAQVCSNKQLIFYVI